MLKPSETWPQDRLLVVSATATRRIAKAGLCSSSNSRSTTTTTARHDGGHATGKNHTTTHTGGHVLVPVPGHEIERPTCVCHSLGPQQPQQAVTR